MVEAEILTRRDLTDERLVARIADRIRREVPGRLLLAEPLSSHTSWRVGGPAVLYAYPDTPAGAATLIKICLEEHLEPFVIGYGTNLLVSDEGFAGCVIDLAVCCRDLRLEEGGISCGAGVWLNDLVRFATGNGLQGLEKLAGIPGGLGGALSMNAGAFGAAISDHLREVDILAGSGDFLTVSRDGIDFRYRRAPGLQDRVVLAARFTPPPADSADLVREMEATLAERFRRNVMTLPSAGSVFKNPAEGYAARLIESANCKGMRVGGVEVSRLHANFIVNLGGGRAADIVELIRRVRERVQSQHGVLLDLEVRTLGFDREI